MLCFLIPTTEAYCLISPTSDTIITNNSTKNFYEILENINDEISEDPYNYTFKKEDILNNVLTFKTIFISTINNYINNKEYSLAQEFLNKYFYLFSDDLQVISLKEFLDKTIKKDNLVEYSGDIEILSFNPLIAYPKIVLNEKNSSAHKIDENNITTDEFKKILLSLYNKNYVLISPDLQPDNQLLLPRNKKPLILVLEDVEYNTKTNGSVEKLIVNNNGEIASYTPKRSINDRIEYDKDFITILEQFVKQHPSFSHNNAKALIAIDGSKGIFGYNTAKSNATSKYQIKKAMEIITHLKNIGYTFISKGYGNGFNSPYINFASGLNSWESNVRPILDTKTNIYFLNSSFTISDDYEQKLELLKTYNYTVILGLEMTPKTEIIDGLKYLSVKQVNGKTLRYCQDSFLPLFDCEYVYDHINRHVTFNE